MCACILILTDRSRNYSLICVCVCVLISDVEEVVEYDPNLLSDPQWPCGRHKRVLIFASYVVSEAAALTFIIS